MDVPRRHALFPVLMALVLAMGCAPGQDNPLPLPGAGPRPYLTATRAVAISPTLPATNVPIPTPTPSTYKVAPGDTLSAIAGRFAISLDDLLAANPGVVPEALSVGQSLKIPARASKGTGAAGPTPVPVESDPAICYPSGTGLYCLAAVHNASPATLGDIKLQISLVDAAGRPLASQEAFLPLDILPAGSTLPAYAFFPGAEAGSAPVAQLVSSIRLSPGDARYLPVTIRNISTSVDWSGRAGQVQGQVFLPASAKAAHGIWLAGVAYDEAGRIVGFRRWEWQGNLQPGQLQAFVFDVYSFGPPIERVELIAEARP